MNNLNNSNWSQTHIIEVCDLFLNDYEYHHLEKRENTTDEWLDQFAGVDILIKKGNAIYGVASRIQKINWASFSIRSKTFYDGDTELKKRKASLNDGSIYPFFTIQAYYDKETDKFVEGARIETKELYEFINNNPDKFHKGINKGEKDNEFRYVYFDDLEDCKTLKRLKIN
jgi:hypothetical protein